MTVIRTRAQLDAYLSELDTRTPTAESPAVLIVQEELSGIALSELARRKQRRLELQAIDGMLLRDL